MLFLLSCSKDDGTTGEIKFPESYTVKIVGSHPDGAIDSEIIVKSDETINEDKIKLKTNANKNSLTIIVNLPASKTASGNKETIGLVISNLDETDIWNIEDTYQTFHFSQHAKQRKRALIDYIIEPDNFYYGSINRFDTGSVFIKREGALLKGTFTGKLETDGNDGVVDVSGSFETNLNDDNLE